MKCQHDVLQIHHRGYYTMPCKREANYRLIYRNGVSECVCGYCKNGIFRSIRGDGYTVEEEISKVEKIEKA